MAKKCAKIRDAVQSCFFFAHLTLLLFAVLVAVALVVA